MTINGGTKIIVNTNVIYEWVKKFNAQILDEAHARELRAQNDEAGAVQLHVEVLSAFNVVRALLLENMDPAFAHSLSEYARQAGAELYKIIQDDTAQSEKP